MGIMKGLGQGLGIGLGFILILYLLSKVSVFGIDGSIKEFARSIGEMFLSNLGIVS